MYLLGIELGSRTIKAVLINSETKVEVGMVQYPAYSMDIISRQKGWAEQQPEVWWQNLCFCTRKLLSQTHISPRQIEGIGLSYQMHGLVLVDQEYQAIRPAIIWCDSRSVAIGREAFHDMGKRYCLDNLLNSPGNFTASKLKWVKDHEPHIYSRIHKVLLPGDYLALRLTGKATTTVSGLSEGIFWNFKEKRIATELLDHFELDLAHLPDVMPTFSIQGRLTKEAAQMSGLAPGIPLTYRAGDQPTNSMALNVLHPGEVAATCGASGVVYGVVDRLLYDGESRVNSFAHVNYEENYNRIGTLLCINGAGMQYSWIKREVAKNSIQYDDMERMAATVPIGSGGVCLLPFGNGAERMFKHKHIGSHILNLELNRHARADIYRASLEGVAFSFVYGMNILKEVGLAVDVIRVGNDDMFRSEIFATTISTLMGSRIEVMETNPATGAAKAAGIAIGRYTSLESALEGTQTRVVHEPVREKGAYEQAYNFWLSHVSQKLIPKNPDNIQTEALTTEISQLKREIQEKRTQVASLALKLNSQQNKLVKFKEQVTGLMNDYCQPHQQTEIRRVMRHLEVLISDRNEWNIFEEHFDLLHNQFLSRLKGQHPELTISDLRMCALIRLDYTSKEIAQSLNLSLRGVETRRYRLRKKLSIQNGGKLSRYLETMV